MNGGDRKYPRLKTFDYAAGGVFCVTVCCEDRRHLLGTVVDGEEAGVILTSYGQIVKKYIDRIPQAYPGTKLLTSIVMPNHIHLLLQIPQENPVSLYTVVRSTKRMVTREIGHSIWQKSYYEHIVRNEQAALAFWKYIDENPKKWALDPYHGDGESHLK